MVVTVAIMVANYHQVTSNSDQVSDQRHSICDHRASIFFSVLNKEAKTFNFHLNTVKCNSRSDLAAISSRKC